MRGMRSLISGMVLALLGAASGHPASAQQTPFPTKFSPELAARADVKVALAYVDREFETQIGEWIHLTEIPGLSGHEQKRAEYIAAELTKLGLTPQSDTMGNVWAVRKGTGGGPSIVFAAHMDTVHPLDTPLKVRREDNGTLHAPGITDDTAALPAQLQALRAMREAKIETKGDLVFLFTVQEEVGLKGMYHWIENNRTITDMLVAVDGGLGPVSYGALGIYWSRMRFSGEGSHTLSSRDKPNPVRAAATCITEIYTVPLPPADDPVPAIYNVGGLLSGGNVVNAIPQDVTFSVDLRTVDPDILKRLDAEIMAKCEAAAAAQKVTFVREWIQRSEAGGRPEQLAARRAHPVVQTAIDVLRFLDVSLPASREAVPSGATDGNVGVLLGIPTVSIGAANGGGGHTLQEWARTDSAKIGTQQVVLLAVSLAEPAGK
ncbi:MAG: M20/M25/M40 family metallo-hydrolase [Acidimicrobiia bacterium]|nr:M20/M25/M40 family metallo-hydrolase [Acidimicrobiia bacterium]